MKRPYKESIDFTQQIINESVTFIVVGSVLIQAVMGDGGSRTTRNALGKLIIIINIIFNYVTLLFMVYKLVLIVKAGIKAYKEYKEKQTDSRKVHRISDSMAGHSTQPSQMSMIHDSTFRSMISHIPKRPSLQQPGDSFFSGFHEDLGHHEFNKNPKAPRNVVVRNMTTEQANASLDESNFQSISLETERPLVFASQARLKMVKPVQKTPDRKPSQFSATGSRGSQPIQSITPPETDRTDFVPRMSQSIIHEITPPISEREGGFTTPKSSRIPPTRTPPDSERKPFANMSPEPKFSMSPGPRVSQQAQKVSPPQAERATLVFSRQGRPNVGLPVQRRASQENVEKLEIFASPRDGGPKVGQPLRTKVAPDLEKLEVFASPRGAGPKVGQPIRAKASPEKERSVSQGPKPGQPAQKKVASPEIEKKLASPGPRVGQPVQNKERVAREVSKGSPGGFKSQRVLIRSKSNKNRSQSPSAKWLP